MEYCFQYNDGVDRSKNPWALSAIESAITDAKKTYSFPAAVNYRQEAEKMRARVPNTDLVRTRIRQVKEVLEANLKTNELEYDVQQALNFFLLQARLNTR